MCEGARNRFARAWPETVLGLLSCAMFLGFLGSVDLWGKREQRAAAEAIDTIERGHWLIAEIQGRPRLEKPPLPRWLVAGLMRATGRRDEWVVRFPAALSGLGMIGLGYALARRIAGRDAALAAGFFLLTNPFFVLECRQGGNDPPLAFFTTLALYAAWRRLRAGRNDKPGSRAWALLFHLAIGLGFLTKGPIIAAIVAPTILGYLATIRRLRRGSLELWDGAGFALFVVLAAAWPAAVSLIEPRAIEVWLLEMAQKTISIGIGTDERRELLALAWPGLTAPWTFVTLAGTILPFASRVRAKVPGIWFVWWCVVGNLAMFCCWRSAKPSYYLPCSPAVAVLTGIAWSSLSEFAKAKRRDSFWSRNLFIGHAIGWIAFAIAVPLAAPRYAPEWFVWSVSGSCVALAAVWAGTILWRRAASAHAHALVPAGAAFVFIGLVLYGALAPPIVAERGQRSLARAIERSLPFEARRVMFFHQLDEGLWFYLRDRELSPIPGSAPEFNDGIAALRKIRDDAVVRDAKRRIERTRKVFLDWLLSSNRSSDYCLMLARDYDDAIADELAGLVTSIFRENDRAPARGPSRLLRRNGVVLLRVEPFGASVAQAMVDPALRR